MQKVAMIRSAACDVIPSRSSVVAGRKRSPGGRKLAGEAGGEHQRGDDGRCAETLDRCGEACVRTPRARWSHPKNDATFVAERGEPMMSIAMVDGSGMRQWRQRRCRRASRRSDGTTSAAEIRLIVATMATISTCGIARARSQADRQIAAEDSHCMVHSDESTATSPRTRGLRVEQEP